MIEPRPLSPWLRLAATLLPAMLAACASGPMTTTAPSTPQQGSNAVASAVTSPLSDFNLVQAAIPLPLLEAQKAPYLLPVDASCDGLVKQVSLLDIVLGTDLDQPASDTNPGLVERSGNLVGDAATSSLQNTVQGVIPFRGWIRKLTGAERYSREVAAAIAAGTARRSFLKGYGLAQKCPWPAAPAMGKAPKEVK